MLCVFACELDSILPFNYSYHCIDGFLILTLSFGLHSAKARAFPMLNRITPQFTLCLRVLSGLKHIRSPPPRVKKTVPPAVSVATVHTCASVAFRMFSFGCSCCYAVMFFLFITRLRVPVYGDASA